MEELEDLGVGSVESGVAAGAILDEEAPLVLSDAEADEKRDDRSNKEKEEKEKEDEEEEEKEAELLVAVEARVRELAEEASLTVRDVLRRASEQFGEMVVQRHRARLKDYLIHLTEEKASKIAKREREQGSAPPAAAGLFDGIEAAQEEEREEEDEDEEEDFRPVKKGKKKQPREKQPKQKKSKKSEQQQGEGDVLAEAPKISSVMQAFRETSDALKARSGGKRGDLEPAHDSLVGEAQALVTEMQLAANTDIESNEQVRKRRE